MDNILFNVCLLSGLYAFWVLTQKFLETDAHNTTKIIDRIHSNEFMYKVHKYLLKNKLFTKYCLIITTLMIDLAVIYYGYDFIINNNHRPMSLVIIGVLLRQLCQYINRLPTPENVIWFDPGFPTLIMNYKVTNDFFFSGHTLSALIFGFEMLTSQYLFIKLYAILYMIGEIGFVMVTRSHYFMDIYGATTTYFMMRYFYDMIFL